MRSIRLLAATSFILLALGACGDDGGGVGPDQNPVAGFTVVPCTVGVACPFTDTSSDPQGANTITTRSWDFNGDGTEDLGGNVVSPTFTYTTAGTFQAKLTVTDNSGNTDDAIVPVTVSGGTTNVPPVASFAIPACTVAADCAFTSTSTDQDGDIALATHSWNFGDGSAAVTGIDVVHQFTAAGTYPVILTVTDVGGASHSVTQSVLVSEPSGSSCTPGLVDVDCTLVVNQRSTLTITLDQLSCELNSRVTVRPPYAQTAFFNVCFQPQGATYTLRDAGGLPRVFEAGTQVVIRFTRGEPGLGEPPAGPPAANLTGTGPNWTISVDDGGNTGGPGEPDFTDVVMSVDATPAP